MGDLISDIKDEAIFRPGAEAVFQKLLEAFSRDWPPYHCLSIGPVQGLVATFRIIQSPTVVALLFNNDFSGDDYRQIFLDGRELPRDSNPTWHGYSVGHSTPAMKGTIRWQTCSVAHGPTRSVPRTRRNRRGIRSNENLS